MASANVKEFDAKAWIAGLPKAVKVVGSLLGLFIGLAIIGGVIESLQPTVKKTSSLSLEQVTPNTAPSPEATETASGLDAQRKQAWQEVKVAYSQLQTSTSEFEQQLLESRAQRWLIAANTACNKDPECESPYAYLLNKYQEYGAELQRITKGGRLRTDAATMNRYYETEGALKEIAQALVTSPSSTPVQTTIPTKAVDDALDGLSRVAGSYDSLREAAAQEAYQQPQDEQGEPQKGGTDQ
jgi:hypothetical protein